MNLCRWKLRQRTGHQGGGRGAHGGDAGGASVWFSWTAPRTEGAFVQACDGLGFAHALVGLYTGGTVNALALVPALEGYNDCQYQFMAVAGVTYRIAVDSKYDPPTSSAAMGPIFISLLQLPDNDDFEYAADLKSYPKLCASGYRTTGATKQAGEPNHAGSNGGASVWFKWTAPETGSAQLSACGAAFHSLLAVYTGSSLLAFAERSAIAVDYH